MRLCLNYILFGLSSVQALTPPQVMVDTLTTQEIHASRLSVKSESQMQQYQVLNQTELERLSPVTTAEALKLAGMATVQQSQVGGGSPILRGFEANRVLLVIDGVRLNNAIYRAGHLQSIISVDPMTLASMEVLMGPSSVSYGSDALGGVIVMNTIKPRFQNEGNAFAKPSASFRYGTAGKEQGYHVQTEIGLGKIPMAMFHSFSYTRRGDLKTGSWHPDGQDAWGYDLWTVSREGGKDVASPSLDPLVQNPSGYQQMDFLSKLLYSPIPSVELGVNFQYSTTSNIPRYDRLSETKDGLPVYAEWYYGPQDRTLLSFDFKHTANHPLLWNQAEILLSYQNLAESRMSRKWNKPMLKHQVEGVQILRLNLDFLKEFSSHQIRYGMDLGVDGVKSKAWQDSVDKTGLGPAVETRYPAKGSSLTSLGIYLGDYWNLNSKWGVDAGLRYQGQILKANFGDSTVLKLPVTQTTNRAQALTGTTGFKWKYSPHLWLGTLFNTGFRAPNVDDLGKVFESQYDSKSQTATLIVPNEHLGAEYAWNGEVSLETGWSKSLWLDLRAHRTYLQDALALGKTTLHGQEIVSYEGIMTTPLSLQNLDNALIWGWSAAFKSQIWNTLRLQGSLNQSYGHFDDDTDRPLDHIAPLAWNTSIAWNKAAYELQLGALGAGKKSLEDYNLLGEDNFVYATPDGLPAWWILNSRVSLKYQQFLRVNFGIENLFDQYYRTFGSGTGAPGRNFVFSITAAL